MKTVVTGGAGFIGSHLADLLIDLNYEVIVIDNLSVGRKENITHLVENSKFTFVQADICNFDLIEPIFMDADWVFHLAALADIVPSIENPTEYYKSNVNGTFNVLQACRKYQVKKIIVSGLIRLGILSGDINEIIDKELYKDFFMHKTGHWLGLDVHDVGVYENKLFEPGMVITVEPGIYIDSSNKNVLEKWRGIGIRIEDDVLITKNGNEVLTKDLVKKRNEIETVCSY